MTAEKKLTFTTGELDRLNDGFEKVILAINHAIKQNIAIRELGERLMASNPDCANDPQLLAERDKHDARRVCYEGDRDIAHRLHESVVGGWTVQQCEEFRQLTKGSYEQLKKAVDHLNTTGTEIPDWLMNQKTALDKVTAFVGATEFDPAEFRCL